MASENRYEHPFADRVSSVSNSYEAMAIAKAVKYCLAYPPGVIHGSKTPNVNSESAMSTTNEKLRQFNK